MGTEEEMSTHEENCYWNYHKKSCRTCKHRDPKSLMQYKCLLGVEILENHLIEFCGKYEWNEKDMSKTSVNDIFGTIFRG
jgi:hypothetical protein